MLLRDDVQIALNDVESLCMEAVDHYAAASERIGTGPLAELMQDLAEQRKREADALADQIRAMGELPKGPDKDSEDVRELLSVITDLFSGNNHASVIDAREHAEARLADAVDAALKHPLPPALRELLVAMQSSIRDARRRLAEHRSG